MTAPTLDRRRKGFRPRLARLAFPAVRAFDDALAGFPCNLLGHDMRELPYSQRSANARRKDLLEFACRRCAARAGFTN